MKGLELARAYWEDCGRPRLSRFCPELLERAAVGLVGEGSECFGFDDALSRDHDWGAGFCLWLTADDYARLGETAELLYASLPEKFCGYPKRHNSDESGKRIGVQEIGSFYARFLGIDRPPTALKDWYGLPESGLAAAANGEIFSDPEGCFTAFREALLRYYPEDLRKKKLAAACAVAAQAGQYNYTRCLRRGETVAAFQALGQFIERSQQIVFLLNRVYRPYYKWTQRRLRSLPLLGSESAQLLDALVMDPLNGEETIEQLAAVLIRALREQGLSDRAADYLLPHAAAIQESIADPQLRAAHLMAE